MRWSICWKCMLPAICLLTLVGCAKRKMIPGIPLMPPPTIATPGDSQQPVPESKANTVEKSAQETNRLLLQNPRFTLSPGAHSPKDVRQMGMITVPVNVRSENAHLDSVVAIQNVLKALGTTELFFRCPDRMRAGSAEQCRFTTGRSLGNHFIDQLQSQGMTPSEASAYTIMVQADLTSPAENAFEIHTGEEPPTKSSLGEKVWRVVPRNPGDYTLEVRVALSASTASAGYVRGIPVVLFHSVSVLARNSLLNKYWPVTIGSLVALTVFSCIGWMLWRHHRPFAVPPASSASTPNSRLCSALDAEAPSPLLSPTVNTAFFERPYRLGLVGGPGA